MDISTVYNNHKKLIKSLAWSAAKKTGIDYDELEAESNMAFVVCYFKYNNNLKWSTWITNNIQKHLLNLLRKTNNNEWERINTDTERFNDNQFSMIDNIDSLSPDCLFVYKEIHKFYKESRINNRLNSFVPSMHTIVKFLRSIGWEHLRIRRALSGLKEFAY